MAQAPTSFFLFFSSEGWNITIWTEQTFSGRWKQRLLISGYTEKITVDGRNPAYNMANITGFASGFEHFKVFSIDFLLPSWEQKTYPLP